MPCSEQQQTWRLRFVTAALVQTSIHSEVHRVPVQTLFLYLRPFAQGVFEQQSHSPRKLSSCRLRVPQ